MPKKPFRKIRYFVKHYILKEHPLGKLTCLIISIILFTYINLEKEETREYSIPINIKNIPKNLMVLKSNTDNVSITLKGKKQTFVIMPSDINASVYVNNATEGTQQYIIEIDNILDIPKNITFTLNPKSIFVTFKKTNSDTNN